MPYYRFEKLEVWQMARQYVNLIYRITKSFPREEVFGLISQMKRAALSILLNIAEGSDRKSDIEFIRFLRIAHSSAQEVIAGFYIALDQSYIDKNSFKEIYEQSNNLSKKINSLINYLKTDKTKQERPVS